LGVNEYGGKRVVKKIYVVMMTLIWAAGLYMVRTYQQQIYNFSTCGKVTDEVIINCTDYPTAKDDTSYTMWLQNR